MLNRYTLTALDADRNVIDTLEVEASRLGRDLQDKKDKFLADVQERGHSVHWIGHTPIDPQPMTFAQMAEADRLDGCSS